MACDKGSVYTSTSIFYNYGHENEIHSLDMNEREQSLFLEHMGHSKNINKENYQCPPGVTHVKLMGRILENIGRGKMEILSFIKKQQHNLCLQLLTQIRNTKK